MLLVQVVQMLVLVEMLLAALLFNKADAKK
jgi:hypothetical protein